MILLDGPYISDFLLDTLARRGIPVIATEYARTVDRDRSPHFIEEAEAIRTLEQNREARLYTPSENSIGWICEHLQRTELPEKISLFKGKAKFPDLLRPEFTDFLFRILD